MLLLNPQALDRFARRHADAAGWIGGWRVVVAAATWQNLQQVPQGFPSADGVKMNSGIIVTVFNVKGNLYRLLTTITYARQEIFIHDLLTHAEYDKNKWKDRI